MSTPPPTSPPSLSGAEMNFVMDEWMNRQIRDALARLEEYPYPPEPTAYDQDGAEGRGGEYKDGMQGGGIEEEDDPIERAAMLEGDTIFFAFGIPP